MTPEELAEQLVARTGWVCPTCVPHAIAAGTSSEHGGLTISITHQRGCGAAASWLLETAPSLSHPPDGQS